MPAQTLEQVKQKQAALEKAFAGLGDSADAAERRALHKKLRRAQRKQRKLALVAGRQAAPKPEAKPEAKPEPAAAEPAAEAPQEDAEE